jgi:predicted Fe-Mo cluster-binding NifX family protein
MKIAAITDNGKTISQHFGRASHYMVVTIEDGKIISREMRDKMGHTQFQGEHHEDHHHEAGEKHGYGVAADNRHGRMSETITDCEAVLCRGMGMGAYENMKARNIHPVVTDIADIDEAVLAYANGQIVDHIEKLH